ncbi:hypothetical protein P8C59_006196 [Phyllachora maydis]|uniref:Uncharacterized protein n=1 Tax=Phyllachora maydis TaxID=1825666 RepID=A0AAD9I698_9PEZI|nr:hypothetical protein P8C59_006196 [Phyllachora maydis]
MYIYIACLPCRYYYRDLSFANLLIANIDFFSDLDNLVYTILAPAPIPAKPAKITLAIRYTAAYEAKQRKLAKAYAIAGRAAAAKRQGLQRSKCTAGGNAGRYTTDSGLMANKDDNNAYNRAYIPPTNTEEEEKEGSSSNDDSVNSSTSNSADKGKGSGIYKRSKGALYCEDILLYKRQYIMSYLYGPPSAPYADIYVYCI